MGRRSVIVGAVALMLALAAPASGQRPEDDKAAVDARIAALQAEIAAAKEQEGVLTSQLSAVASELREAQSAVDEAQGLLGTLESQLAAEEARLGELTSRLAEQTRRLRVLQAEFRRAVAILEARVRQIYIEESPDVLSFLVSASSFDELVDNFELMTRIGLQDKRIARQVETAKVKTAQERKETQRTRALQAATVSVIDARTREARGMRDRLAAGRDTLASARNLKEQALSDARHSREEYLEEANALAEESAALAAAIRAAQSGSSSTGPSGSTGAGAPSSSGFVWPVDGVVVSGYGMRWGRMHEGIDITASTGTPIRAAAAGSVIWSGWRGGYGNAVIIDHGNGLSTVYAHASALLVSQGQRVSQGQTVALVGSTGNSSGPHLHFEVRINGAAVDPLLYL
ncbi:MAG: peptidoglycan DD-metalloendopeptidase family protein [Gaiellaceae bacterium]